MIFFRNLLCGLCSLFLTVGQAQSNAAAALFQPIDKGAPSDALSNKVHPPKAFKSYQLDFETLKSLLQKAPMEHSVSARQRACTLFFPNPDGRMEAFSVWKTDIMAPELGQKYPEIQTYNGESTETPGKNLRLTISSRGLRLMLIRPDLTNAYLEPIQWGQTDRYWMYEAKDAADADGVLPQSCGLDDRGHTIPTFESSDFRAEDRAAGMQLRIIRFAVSTNGEFSEDHGGTLQSVLASVVEYVNMMDAVYERDMGARLQLVANNDKLIFLDPATDPFTGTDVGEHAGDNRLLVNTLIGLNNFDVGHVFSRYIQGTAIGVSLGLGIACTNSKASACSAGRGTGSYGQSFIGTACHEVSHQLSGPHSWNRCGDNSSGQRSGNNAVEPGSGTTIMSYAGACGGDDIKQGKDLYFHGSTINIVRGFITEGNGCGIKVDLNNSAPTVTLPYKDGFFIPIGTHFELKGEATDADGDTLTYCWEQIDTGPEMPFGQASGDSPLFRSFPAVSTPLRGFPATSLVLQNGKSPAELLPDTTRNMTFMLTVRDNNSGGSGVTQVPVAFFATDQAGPFEVTNPNTFGVIWRVGQYEQVAWKVANTDKPPVNCSKVNIRLSLDNGLTFPIMLAENTDNDGSHYVLVPPQLSNIARIRVEAANNIFLDYSNRSMRILNPTTPTFTLSLSTESSEICLPTTFQTTIAAAGTLGFSTPATLRIKDESALPPGAKYSFSSTTLAPGSSTVFNLELPNLVGTRADTFVIVAEVPGYDTIERAISLRTLRNDFSDLVLRTPVDGANGMALSQTLRWNKSEDAILYDVQIATSPAFEPTDMVASRSGITSDSFKVLTPLQKSKAYYWRVRPINACGVGPWTETNFFATFTDKCAVLSANDLPKSISASGTPTVESKINVAAGSAIDAVSVNLLRFNHQFFKEIDATLISPQGTEVTLFKNKCGSQSANFNFTFSDGAPTTLDCQSLVGGNKTIRPETPLAAFKGQNSTGTWTLRMRDNTSTSGGTIQDFKLEFCTSVSLNGPFIDRNEGMTIDPNTNRAITPDLLRAKDDDNTPAQLTFTLTTVPRYGHLEKTPGSTLRQGDTFTQADIDAGTIRYFDHGSGQTEDYFRFTVNDGAGGFVGTPKFVIRALVNLGETADLSKTFTVFPNPATEQIWIAFPKALSETTQLSLIDVSGRLVQSVLMGTGTESHVLGLHNLPKGLYFVRIDNPLGTGTKKVAIQ